MGFLCVCDIVLFVHGTGTPEAFPGRIIHNLYMSTSTPSRLMPPCGPLFKLGGEEEHLWLNQTLQTAIERRLALALLPCYHPGDCFQETEHVISKTFREQSLSEKLVYPNNRNAIYISEHPGILWNFRHIPHL